MSDKNKINIIIDKYHSSIKSSTILTRDIGFMSVNGEEIGDRHTGVDVELALKNVLELLGFEVTFGIEEYLKDKAYNDSIKLKK